MNQPTMVSINQSPFSPVVGLELPFMMMPHPLIPVSLPPASVSMAMSQMNHLSTIANMAAAAQQQSLPCRMVTSVIKERVPDSPSPAPSLEDGRRPGSHPSSHRSSSVSSSPARTESSSDRIRTSPYSLPMQRVRLANCVFSAAKWFVYEPNEPSSAGPLPKHSAWA
ncbi:unnamed protein product [Coregonus sp. 'balchen']|nr:unnamed protein product [Coregonus sp. 'balchen']